MYEPVVLILSLDETVKPGTIVEKIRKQPNDQNQVKRDSVPISIDYPYQIQAKCCDVINLVPHDSAELDSIRDRILGWPDGIVIYFDAKNRSILEVLPNYRQFVEIDQKSTFNILLCNTLMKSSEDGVTFDEVKKLCPTFNVIELEPDDAYNASKSWRTPIEKEEMQELIQAMQNHVWTKPTVNQSKPGDKSPTSTTQPPPPRIAANPTNDDNGQFAEEDIRMMETKLMMPEHASPGYSDDKSISEPVVLIISLDDTIKPESIVEKIRKQPNDQNQVRLVKLSETVGYPYHIHTKYYTADVVLVAHGSSALGSIPNALLKRIEGILIYFNAKDRSFLEVLPDYRRFVNKEDIEFGVLLCNTLAESSADGVTYGEVKKICPVLDVIELEPSAEDVANAATAGEAIGVEELIQEIHAHVWSNPIMHRGTTQVGPSKEPSASTAPPPPIAVNATNDDDGPVTEEEEKMIEAELNGFERLLTEVMDFQPNTSSWSRNERLMYAQELAEMFDDMVEEDD
ncbi:uncharacterized protein LOC131267581 isoform X2 [Anopheles coustani]|uniref:uncharacterized protein LOC131267581 isoform X2 n=1 Tax=Anopheles coustani TaxID=139045 RepID=UPI00265A075D|nr:uncharacterized protein LOC131267581 isoform X2 [Anopheles coustani]